MMEAMDTTPPESQSSEAAASPAATASSADASSTDRHEQAPAASASAASGCTFRLVFKKDTHSVTMDPTQTVAQLKEEAQKLTGVPVSMMKLMFKGLLKDDTETLSAAGIRNGSKLMVVGSTLDDVLAVAAPQPGQATAEVTSKEKKSQKFCEMEKHKKILSKGKPDDAVVGIKGQHDPLPMAPLSGMVNSINGKVRLTFKLEQDELWIGTKVRTDKIPMAQIQNIQVEPIVGHEEYHLMGLQLGPTEQSRYWIYWVPSQFVRAIKKTIVGHI